ncbi:hypothetical protein [Streptomyces profundus]|uniref:hypothetical protein n=1 Tax=Streptomyces profundus TaxID=2867410 RepID=UPI001D163142|nr:hypothetical protein [Streptomyces sp. MA3_2.13]UED87959.1 hypothetical protein K4G22_30290 [Streptomyces sp. MA3_2.13]
MNESLSRWTREITPHRRLCLAADMEEYSRLDTRSQSTVQSDLVRLLDEAAALTGLNRDAWARQPQGDQEFAVLPEATREVAVLGPFVRHLVARLGALNARPATPRVRLRLAVDTGIVADAALGHAGPAPVAVARYVNAPQLKAVLAALPPADLAVIVSDRLYQDVVRLGHPDLDQTQYAQVHVRVKDFGGYGWIHVPGHAPDEVHRSLADTSGPMPSPDGPAPTRTAPSQYAPHGVNVGHDLSGSLTIGLPVAPPAAGHGRAL